MSARGLIAAGIVGGLFWALQRVAQDRTAEPDYIVRTTTTPDNRDLAARLSDGLFGIFDAVRVGDTQRAQTTGQAVLQEFMNEVPTLSTGTPFASSAAIPATYAPARTGGIRPVLDIIGQAEAPRGYDQYWGGIARADAPPRPLTQMTVQQVLDWQDSIDPKYNSEAAGRYQVMEDTLRGLVRQGKVRASMKFDARGQDYIAEVLLQDAGLNRWRQGSMTDQQFADRIARIWAGIPVQFDQRGHKIAVRRGDSYYAQFAGNKATVSADAVLAAVKRSA